MKNLSEIFRLPKWAKISLVALSGIAFSLLVAVFALQSWADSQVETANLTFSKIDRAKSADLENGYAYEARVHFPRLEFLLRSKSISKIDITNIAWSGIDSSAITSYESHNNRRVKFTTTQNLALDSGANLGTMSYKMDFSPCANAILFYYISIVFAVIFAYFVLAISGISMQQKAEASLGGGELHSYHTSRQIHLLSNRPLCFALPTIFHAKFYLSYAKRRFRHGIWRTKRSLQKLYQLEWASWRPFSCRIWLIFRAHATLSVYKRAFLRGVYISLFYSHFRKVAVYGRLH